jgi:hypothetical protein
MSTELPEIKMTMPSTIGEAIDLLYKMRSDRLILQKTLDEAQAKETLLKSHIIQNFAEVSLEGAKGLTASASLKRTTQANVTDWDAYHKYIIDNDAWDLMQKRTSITGLKERWDNKEVIPGVESFVVLDISLTKSSR